MLPSIALQGRSLHAATLRGMRAAGMKPAAGWNRKRTRHIPLEDHAAAARARLRQRNRRGEWLGIRMARGCDHGFLLCKLDDLAEIHHRDAVGDVLHHGKVVGDEDVAEPKPRLKILEKIDDLRAHRDIER